MKRTILTIDEKRRNARLKELHQKKVDALLVSGNTGQLESWNVNEIVSNRKEDRDRIVQYEIDNTIGRNCNGLTYLEIEQLNNTYNNFR